MTIHSSRPGLERIRRETGTTHDPLHLVAAEVLAPVIIELCGVHRGMVRRLTLSPGCLADFKQDIAGTHKCAGERLK